MEEGPLDYTTISALPSLSLQVRDAASEPFEEPAGAEGSVEVLALDDEQICLDISVTMTRDGREFAAAEGVVLAPVVRAANTVWRY